MNKKQNPLKSVRVKLFATISIVIVSIIVFLIVVNNFVLGQFYLYSKRQTLKSVYQTVNDYYNDEQDGIKIFMQHMDKWMKWQVD